MKSDYLGKQALAYCESGFCCSEAISRTIIEHFATDPDGYPVRVASGFCRGMASSTEDVCGALAGGVISVGYLLGRMEPGREVVKVFRQTFIEAFGSTNCRTILDALGAQEKSGKCKALTAQATVILADLLERHREQRDG